MDRTELTLAVAGALVLAVLFGWTLALIAGRLNAPAPGGAARGRDLVARLDAAETARRASEARLAAVESDLRARLGEAEADLADALARLDSAQEQTEEVRAAYRSAMQDGAG